MCLAPSGWWIFSHSTCLLSSFSLRRGNNSAKFNYIRRIIIKHSLSLTFRKNCLKGTCSSLFSSQLVSPIQESRGKREFSMDFYALREEYYELFRIINKNRKINKHENNKWIFTSIICISFILSRLDDFRRTMHFYIKKITAECFADEKKYVESKLEHEPTKRFKSFPRFEKASAIYGKRHGNFDSTKPHMNQSFVKKLIILCYFCGINKTWNNKIIWLGKAEQKKKLFEIQFDNYKT